MDSNDYQARGEDGKMSLSCSYCFSSSQNHLQHGHVDAVELLRLPLEAVPVLHGADVLLMLRQAVLLASSLLLSPTALNNDTRNWRNTAYTVSKHDNLRFWKKKRFILLHFDG